MPFHSPLSATIISDYRLTLHLLESGEEWWGGPGEGNCNGEWEGLEILRSLRQQPFTNRFEVCQYFKPADLLTVSPGWSSAFLLSEWMNE